MGKNLIRHLIVTLTSLAFVISASGQGHDPLYGWGLETNIFTGKVIKHSKKFHVPIPDLSTGIDVNFTYHTYGKKEWEARRGYPVLGIGFAYTNYGIDSAYGRCIGIYPNVTIPLIMSRKLEWTLRIGDGFGYVTHRYGRIPITDTMNNAIGSRVNDYASFNMDIRYRINKHWDVQAGANFSHISDASYHQPNLGVNLAGTHFGIRYFPVTGIPEHVHRTLKPLRNRVLMQVRGGIAFTQSEAANGPTYPVYLASAFVSRRYLSKNKMFAGIDYSYHESIAAFLRNNLILPGEEKKHAYKSALLIGNEFLFGRVGVVLQVGYYIKEAELKQDPYYEKLGGNFYLVKKEKGPIKELFVTGLLKTHKTIAELAEFGIGLGF